MIEGVVVTNGLSSPEADRIRTDLWLIMDPDDSRVGIAAA